MLRKKPEVKYAFIRQHALVFSIVAMCRVLDATRSGYYKSVGDKKTLRQRVVIVSMNGWKVCLFGSKGCSGPPMITLDLADV